VELRLAIFPLEIAIGQLIPSPAHSIFDRPIDVMIRRPVSDQHPRRAPHVLHQEHRQQHPRDHRPVPARLRRRQHKRTERIAASTISCFSAPCVPTAGASCKLEHSAPRNRVKRVCRVHAAHQPPRILILPRRRRQRQRETRAPHKSAPGRIARRHRTIIRRSANIGLA
jgi:hypothetical protein